MIRSVLALALVATLSTGCNGNSSGRLSAPSSTPPPSSPPSTAPVTTKVYTLSVYSGDNQSGTAYMPFGTGKPLPLPFVVEVRDAAGSLADGVYVLFSGPLLGLGTDTSGAGMWIVSQPGSGRSAVSGQPYQPGPATVTAQVIPLPWSTGATSGSVAETSNAVTFVVTGN